MNLKKNWKPVIDRFLSKLSMWKSNSLSFEGRLTLITSVLGNLPTFYLSLFVAPIGVIDTLEKIRRNFLWGGSEGKYKINWVAWEKVIAAKRDGGLGVGSIKALNVGLIAKWWWRLRTKPDLLWSQVIAGIHNLHSKPPDYYANKYVTGTWKNIAGMQKQLVKVGISINEVLANSDGPGNNGWTCSLAHDGVYKVRVLRHTIYRSNPLDISNFDWLAEIPKKVLCFSWRAKMGRIPSAVALNRRGIGDSNNLICTQCNEEPECADHLLVKCSFARTVMVWILNWCGISDTNFESVTEALDFAANWGNCPNKRRTLQTIFQGTLWSIWKARNDRIFGNRRIPPTKVADIIKSTVFIWMKHQRIKNAQLNWTYWSANAFTDY